MMECLALDFDGVLADTSGVKREWIRKNLAISIRPGAVCRSSLVPVIGQEAYQLMQSQVGFEDTLEALPMPGMIDAVGILAQQARLIVISARPERKILWLRAWLHSHGLDRVISGVLSSHGCEKLQVASDLRCECLVDDDIRHYRDGATTSFVLFGDYPAIEAENSWQQLRSWGDITKGTRCLVGLERSSFRASLRDGVR